MAENENNVSWEIKEQLAVLKENSTGWKKELNIVSWNGGSPKFDIREWSEDHLRMSRGVTFSMEEGKKVCDIMNRYLEKEQEREAKAAREHGYER